MVGGRMAGGAPDGEQAESLLEWYARFQRKLPWRLKPTPYRVWVSEILLQQTQMDRVIPYYERFLERFPNVESLAAASEDEVLALWSGLGYYRRGRQLHAAARVVVDEHAGRFPDDLGRALELPGIGRYTAGAILSIAYNKSVPILDGNVERVLTRLHALGGDPRRSPLRQRLWAMAAEMIPSGRARHFNQALMELGALVCTPTNPRCDVCPWRSECAAKSRGEPERYPEKAPSRESVQVHLGVAVVQCDNRVLVVKTPRATRQRGDRPNTGGVPDYLGGLWNFPILEIAGAESAVGELTRYLATAWGGDVELDTLAGTARHSITFRRITLHVWVGQASTKPRRGGAEAQWVWAEPAELGDRYAVPSMVWKVLRLIAASTAGPSGLKNLPKK